MLNAWFCNSEGNDNTKTPTIVSLIDSFILTHKSKIIGREWEMKKNIKHSKKSEQYNVLTLKPYRSGNLTKLSESSRNNRFSSNLWGTKKQILLLKGRIKKDEEGTFLKFPIKKDFFEVFNLNQTTLKEEKLNELRDSIHPYTIKSTIWEIMD